MTDTSSKAGRTDTASGRSAAWTRIAGQWGIVLAVMFWILTVVDLVAGKFGFDVVLITVALVMSFLLGGAYIGIARLVGRFTLTTRLPLVTLAAVLLPLSAIPVLLTIKYVWESPMNMATLIPLVVSLGAIGSLARVSLRRAVTTA
ncbi:hypothetical protein D1871_01045 [Nakamurella silvestris]|nr:hypothetical protein D1871_01045 [Nakamurella silvestris]